MAVSRILSGSGDIVNGLAVVCAGQTTQSYDNKQRTQHVNDIDNMSLFENLEGRYLFHGGPGGSGNWEH